MRRFVCFLLFWAIAPIVFALEFTVRKFDSRYDRLEFEHIPGGIRSAALKKKTGAAFVTPAGFHGYKGGKRYGVDLIVKNGKELVKSTRKRPVIARFQNGAVRIFSNYTEYKKWGISGDAAEGMSVPPDPKRVCARQLIAVKGHYYYCYVVIGTARQCKWLLNKWGFKAFLHFDGGNSLDWRYPHPCQMVVYHMSPIA